MAARYDTIPAARSAPVKIAKEAGVAWNEGRAPHAYKISTTAQYPTPTNTNASRGSYVLPASFAGTLKSPQNKFVKTANQNHFGTGHSQRNK